MLAYEMRQTELSNWRDLLGTFTDYKGLIHDAEFADLAERGHADYGALSPAEQRSFGLYLGQGVHVYGNFLKHNNKHPQKLDDAVANYCIDMLTTPGGAVWWTQTRGLGHFMLGTCRVVDQIISAGRKATDR